MNHNQTNIELSLVCKMIASRMGLHFPVDRWAMLSQNLSSAAVEFGYSNLNEFIHWLLTGSMSKEQMEIFASYLTISETYFWREPDVFAAFSQNTLIELVSSKNEGERNISIWCAGCSTGEEAYSIAIALHRTIPQIKDWNITIMATDINTKALSKAKIGVYGQWSFRNSPSWLRRRYFKSLNNKEYEIIPEIKKMVTFSGFNLTHENFLTSVCKNHKMDIIFCRNVLMYFTNEWMTKISLNFFHSLSENGWLVVSSCELSSEQFPQFIPVNFPGAVLYQKGKKAFSGSEIQSFDIANPILINVLHKSTTRVKVVNQLIKEDSKNTAIVENIRDKLKTDFQSEAVLRDLADSQLQLKTRKEILNENKISIRLLANQGYLEEALNNCNEAIASDKLSTGLYFLRASILQELDKSHEAIKSLKQAIYIDPDYIMGHFTIGNLFIRLGTLKNAKRHFNNALELLNTIPNDEVFAESEGLSAKYIREIILHNLQTQTTR